MTTREALQRSKTLETGPKSLATVDVDSNRITLEMGEIWHPQGHKQPNFFNGSGIFYVLEHRSYQSDLPINPLIFWSAHLLQSDSEKHILKIGEQGDLLMHNADATQAKIISAEDIRKIDTVFSFNGIVNKSGFVLPAYFPPFPLGDGRRLTPEELGHELLEAEKRTGHQLSYHRTRSFAKVDQSLSGEKVLMLCFESLSREIGKSIMETDAVVIDAKGQKLVPRTFVRVDPESQTTA